MVKVDCCGCGWRCPTDTTHKPPYRTTPTAQTQTDIPRHMTALQTPHEPNPTNNTRTKRGCHGVKVESMRLSHVQDTSGSRGGGVRTAKTQDTARLHIQPIIRAVTRHHSCYVSEPQALDHTKFGGGCANDGGGVVMRARSLRRCVP